MIHRARGAFEVQLANLPAYNIADVSFGRRAIDKQFRGDLTGISQGEMLSVGASRDNAGYVAIERVTGTLHGMPGSFALMHNATMTAGAPLLNIIVVPGSGSDALSGLRGSMNIQIAADGAHTYDFEYALPDEA